MSRRLLVLLHTVIFPVGTTAIGAPIINEIMFHPAGAPENPAAEWIELTNTALDADLGGWKLDAGVVFDFLPGTTMPAGGFLIGAANPGVFHAEHPEVTAPVVGPWQGRLDNTGATVRLRRADDHVADEVSYFDEGEWALRTRSKKFR
jgi:Lamin Tail Domain